MNDCVVAKDTGDGSLFRTVDESANYLVLNSIAKVDGGYSFNITSLSAAVADVTIFMGSAPDGGEDPAGWSVASEVVRFSANGTEDVAVTYADEGVPYFIIRLESVGTTLAEGEGVPFWQWSDIGKCTMEPTVSPALHEVTATSATFDVTLGYKAVVTGMEPPAIALKAYYGATDAGVGGDWGSTMDFGSDNAAGTCTCSLEGLTNGTYYVRFAAKTADSDWIWSDCLTLATSGPYLYAVSAMCENDPVTQSILVFRPNGAREAALDVYLSYSGALDKISGSLPASVHFGPGDSVIKLMFTLIDNDLEDGSKTITASIVPDASYPPGNPTEVTVTILDDETQAAEIVWTGAAGDGKWETVGNWSTNRVPTAMDVAVFTEDSPASGGTVTVTTDQACCRVLKISRTGAMTFAGEGGNPKLKLGGIVREDVEGAEGVHEIAVPLAVFGSNGVTNTWYIAGSGDFNINADVTAATPGVVIRKTGSARLCLVRDEMSYAGSWHIAEGKVLAGASNRMRGAVIVGGEDTAAELSLSSNKSYVGNTAVVVDRNGKLYMDGGMNDSRISSLTINEGGWARGGYLYLGGYYMCGGTLVGTDWSDAISTWPEYITTYASESNALFNLSYSINWWNPFTITVEDGAAPVDLTVKSFSGDNADVNNAEFKKTGPGVMRVTGSCSTTRTLKIDQGTWLADNAESGCTRASLTVAAGATLGGVGSVLGSYYPDGQTDTVTVNGSSGKPGCLMPGSIDEKTGDHIYGTLTIGGKEVTNRVVMGNYTCLKIGAGPRNRETNLSDVDKLMVYGEHRIGENCTLDLVSNSCEDLDLIHGGTYTIVEATGGITGTFAEIVRPKNSWRVNYVSDGEKVVRIDLTVPFGGLTVVVR